MKTVFDIYVNGKFHSQVRGVECALACLDAISFRIPLGVGTYAKEANQPPLEWSNGSLHRACQKG